jgi:phosphocarrier protein
VIEREARIVNSLGLHARPAAQIVRLAANFTAHIELEKDDLAVNAKSIMGVMMLAAESGSTVRIRAEGEDEAQAVAAIADLVASGFGET